MPELYLHVVENDPDKATHAATMVQAVVANQFTDANNDLKLLAQEAAHYMDDQTEGLFLSTYVWFPEAAEIMTYRYGGIPIQLQRIKDVFVAHKGDLPDGFALIDQPFVDDMMAAYGEFTRDPLVSITNKPRMAAFLKHNFGKLVFASTW